jgi:hypothetical protein
MKPRFIKLVRINTNTNIHVNVDNIDVIEESNNSSKTCLVGLTGTNNMIEVQGSTEDVIKVIHLLFR